MDVMGRFRMISGFAHPSASTSGRPSGSGASEGLVVNVVADVNDDDDVETETNDNDDGKVDGRWL